MFQSRCLSRKKGKKKREREREKKGGKKEKNGGKSFTGEIVIPVYHKSKNVNARPGWPLAGSSLLEEMNDDCR